MFRTLLRLFPFLCGVYLKEALEMTFFIEFNLIDKDNKR